MNQPIDVTTDGFKEQVLRATKPVLVDFWADWCGPCRKMEPVVQEIADEVDSVQVCKINVDREPQLAGLYHINSVPTLMLFRGGKAAATMTGMHSKENILRMLEQTR